MATNVSRILVVEDEAIVAMDLNRRLERLGYRVAATVPSAEEALSLLEADTPDLILMDVRLAGEMDGIEAATVIRQRYDLPVIFVTAHTDTGTLERARLAEPFGYIVKPIETIQLSTMITMALYKHQMEAQVKASEAKFRRLAEVNPAIILILEPTERPGEYETRYVNPAFIALVGTETVPALLTADTMQDALTSEQFAVLSAALDQVTGGRSQKSETEFQFTATDGRPRWFSAAIVPITYEGRPAVMLAGTDLTRLREAESERIELTLEKERRHFLQHVVDDFSHDFRNPLAAIRASVYLMKHVNDPAKVTQYQDIVEHQVIHLEEMVEDIMHMSRLETEPTLELEPICIEELVREAINSQMGAALEKHQTLVCQSVPADARVIGDRTLLHRAVANIISNAVRYTPSAGQITVSARLSGKCIEIEVLDSGIGIVAEDFPHIFERFYRGTRAKSFAGGGTGLGLAISKKIVEMHHGSIAVSSSAGQGSRFSISLPLAADANRSCGASTATEARSVEWVCASC